MEKRGVFNKLLFDQQDRMLLKIVDDVRAREKSRGELKRLFNPYMHPRGIKELAAVRSLRIAHAVVNVIDSLEVGSAGDRVEALRSLRGEIMYGAPGDLSVNAARVMLKIMKELYNNKNGDNRLVLAHEFNMATSGNPASVRYLLKKHRLLEMPEQWNQISFDGHVHDSSTKGLKAPSHLIMDAWIKGIRFLTVVYYNHVTLEAAEELLRSAQIMNVNVRIGVEFTVSFRKKEASLIWVPRGFSDIDDFLAFLRKYSVEEIMNKGKECAEAQNEYILEMLKYFNSTCLPEISKLASVCIRPIQTIDLLREIGFGQAAVVHLTELAHKHILDCVSEQGNLGAVNTHIPQPFEIYDNYLAPYISKEKERLRECSDSAQSPSIRQMTPRGLAEKLKSIHSGFRIILNLNKLAPEDVLEIIYDCEGMITHLEIYNLKDHALQAPQQIVKINDIRKAVNSANAVRLKRIISNLTEHILKSDESDRLERAEKFKTMLKNMENIRKLYAKRPLKSRVGSDSAGRSSQSHGMGLAVLASLPRGARKEAARLPHIWQITPIAIKAFKRISLIPDEGAWRYFENNSSFACSGTSKEKASFKRHLDWEFESEAVEIVDKGNVVCLGAHTDLNKNVSTENDFSLKGLAHTSKYLNTGIKNVSKVAIGFIPAFATFYFTKDWFVLAYFGAFIWFGVTGLRNILQSVLGGGGLRRSPLLTWKDYVNWERIADSLMFTGFSVPLLDWIVKTLLMNNTFGVTVETNPALLYSTLAIVNGIYISSHNLYRGLPKEAVIGNLFRSAFSIPLAIAANASLGGFMTAAGVVAANDILQKSAAIISKIASDSAAGVIEGIADRNRNIKERFKDYREKLYQALEAFARLDLMFPEIDMSKAIASPKTLFQMIKDKDPKFEKIIIVNALDMMYFWLFQPRAKIAFKSIACCMDKYELLIVIHSQHILKSKLDIGLLFVDGIIVGKDYSKALSFYMDYHESYLNCLDNMFADIVRN
jgi:hypothetical protein